MNEENWTEQEKDQDFDEMISQMKEKFNLTQSRSEKIQILTVLPKSWEVRKITREFNTSRHMVKIAKDLVSEKGIMSYPNKRKGRKLDQGVVDKVVEFYLSEENSRIMPGKKDVSLRIDGKREHYQKQLLLYNLNELYRLFLEKFPEFSVSFSKFASLRPKQCILVGSGGTHSVCVLTIHQNMNLMFDGAGLLKLTDPQSQDKTGKYFYQ